MATPNGVHRAGALAANVTAKLRARDPQGVVKRRIGWPQRASKFNAEKAENATRTRPFRRGEPRARSSGPTRLYWWLRRGP